MNIDMTLKRMTTVDMQLSDFVPGNGEIIMDETSNKIKIGDGVTPIKDLSWVHLGIDLSTEPSRKYKMSDSVKYFIEQYIDLIEECRFDELYSMMNPASIEFIRDVTAALLEAGINPTPYLTTVPRSIQDMLLNKVDNVNNKTYTHDYNDWSLDYNQIYTKPEIDAKLHEVTEKITKKLYDAMSIPAHLITIKGEQLCL